MRIARDGTWYHQGQPITRPAMVRLFSTVLRREPDGSHVLVTPVEKLTIEVEATAFIALEMESEGASENRRIALSLNSGDALVVGRDHPLTIVEDEHGPQPARRSSATASKRRSPARYIMSSPRSPWPRATTRPACGATAASSR